MKVLHVITGLDVGGAEIQLSLILKHTRHDSDVVTLYNPGPVADQIRAGGTSVRDIGMRRNTQLSALLRLRSMIARGHYDVVHTHLYRSQVYARPAARLAGTPVVLTTEHSIGETHIERRRMTAGVRGLYLASELFSDATIAVSDVVRERLIRWGVPAEEDHRHPERAGHRRARLRRRGAPAGARAVRHPAGHVRDRSARAAGPQQAHRPDRSRPPCRSWVSGARSW